MFIVIGILIAHSTLTVVVNISNNIWAYFLISIGGNYFSTLNSNHFCNDLKVYNPKGEIETGTFRHEKKIKNMLFNMSISEEYYFKEKKRVYAKKPPGQTKTCRSQDSLRQVANVKHNNAKAGYLKDSLQWLSGPSLRGIRDAEDPCNLLWYKNAQALALNLFMVSWILTHIEFTIYGTGHGFKKYTLTATIY